MRAAGLRHPACEPVQPVGPIVPLDAWPLLRARNRWRLPIPTRLDGYRAGGYCRDPRPGDGGFHAHGAGEAHVGRYNLVMADRVGPYIVAVVYSPHYLALLINRRTGTVLRALRVRGVITGDPNERFVEKAMRARATGERAALMLREQHAPRPGRRLLEAEAWLRRQLAGLGHGAP